MSSGCSDVCEVAMDMLHSQGFRFDDSDNHDDILEALGSVRFVRVGGIGSYCPEDGAQMVTVCNHGADVCYTCPECDTHWEYVDGAYRSTQGSTNCDVHGACEYCTELG